MGFFILLNNTGHVPGFCNCGVLEYFSLTMNDILYNPFKCFAVILSYFLTLIEVQLHTLKLMSKNFDYFLTYIISPFTVTTYLLLCFNYYLKTEVFICQCNRFSAIQRKEIEQKLLLLIKT